MKIDLGRSKFTQHVIEQVSFIEAFNNVVEIIGFHHLTRSRGKLLNIVTQVLLKVVRIIKKGLECEV